METATEYKNRIAAWAAREYRLAAQARAAKEPDAGAVVFDDPKASFAEVAEASIARSGVSADARANMSAAAKERESRRREKIRMPSAPETPAGEVAEPLPPVSDAEFLRHETGEGE